MSGPFCKTCIYYGPGFFEQGEKSHGYCKDPTKAIYQRYGFQKNLEAEVDEDDYCSNHTPTKYPEE